jgi:hypothetical protein
MIYFERLWHKISEKELFVLALIVLIVFFLIYQSKNSGKLREIRSADKGKEHGVVFGKKGSKVLYSPEDSEGHIGVFSASGTGKTSAIGIPTLRTWHGTSYVIDISGDICKNCPNMPNDKLVFSPETSDSAPYNLFGVIDDLSDYGDKNEALEQLAFLLMPNEINMNDNAKFFLVNGRKILTASLIAFYSIGMDFIDIATKIVESDWSELFREIDKTENKDAIIYINSFLGASEQNTAGCKQTCDEALKLFATNAKIKRSIRRPKEGEAAIQPKMLEKNNIFVVVGEDKLALYMPLMNIITSQIMQYIGTRKVTDDSLTILLFLDEYGSLKIDSNIVLDSVRRFRKRKCRVMLLMQNISDMTILYGGEVTRAILSNLRFKILLGGLGEPESQKYFAELIGYKKNKKVSKTKNSGKTVLTETEAKEWVIEPADLDRQGKDCAILILSSEKNGYIRLKKNYYFRK